MKCRIDSGNTCRRCQRSGAPCVFVPRANVVNLWQAVAPKETSHPQPDGNVLDRLRTIEILLGIHVPEPARNTEELESVINLSEVGQEGNDSDPFWSNIAALKRVTPSRVDAAIWQKETIRELWSRSVSLALTIY